MGVDTLNSITYSGTARNGAFGQSKAIGEPWGPSTSRGSPSTRARSTSHWEGTPTALVSRATGPTQPPTVPGVPAPMPGVFNQNITAQQASTNWNQGLNIWTTPWGFLKGAAANNATVRQEGGQQLVSFTPPNLKSPSGQTYSVTGYINGQNLVSKVETRVDNAVVGDLLVEFEYSNYQNMNGVQVPTRMVQKQAGMATFDAEIKSATPNPANLTALLTPPPPPAGGPRRRARRSSTSSGGCAGREAWRRGLQDRRQLHLACRRHGRPHPRRRERPERRARHGGDGGGEEGDSEQANPVRRQLTSALRSRERPCGSRRRKVPRSSHTATTRRSSSG